MMSIRINWKQSVCSIVAIGVLIGCASTTPPALPPGNPADAQARVSENGPNNVLVHDETTVAIQKELSQTASRAKGAETMHHDMSNMRGMKMEDHKEMSPQTTADSEKAVAEEMKKTSEEMKKTSEEMKQKSEQTSSQDFYYTCQMHLQIHADKPGKCPICGMTLIKKEGVPPK